MNRRDKETGRPPVPPTNRADKGKRILESEYSQPRCPVLHHGHLFKFSKSKVEDETTILKLVNEFLYHNPGVDPSSKFIQLHRFIEENTWVNVNQTRLADILSNLEKDYWRIVDENGDIRTSVVEKSFEQINPQVLDLSQKIWGKKQGDDQEQGLSFLDDGNFLFKKSRSSFQDNVSILKILVHFCISGGEGFDPSVHSKELHEFIVKTAKEYVSATIMSHRISKLEKLYGMQAELMSKNPRHLRTDQGKMLYYLMKKIWGSNDEIMEIAEAIDEDLELAYLPYIVNGIVVPRDRKQLLFQDSENSRDDDMKTLNLLDDYLTSNGGGVLPAVDSVELRTFLENATEGNVSITRLIDRVTVLEINYGLFKRLVEEKGGVKSLTITPLGIIDRKTFGKAHKIWSKKKDGDERLCESSQSTAADFTKYRYSADSVLKYFPKFPLNQIPSVLGFIEKSKMEEWEASGQKLDELAKNLREGNPRGSELIRKQITELEETLMKEQKEIIQQAITEFQSQT